MTDKTELVKLFTIELARRDFYTFCQLMMPDFYRHGLTYQKTLCDDLQNFVFGDDQVLVVNLPPRHGKSLTVGLLVAWLLGRDSSYKIMTGSYNERLSGQLSQQVRDRIATIKGDETKTVYSDIFPGTQIAYGNATKAMWSVEGGYNNFLATSPGGTATGFGADLEIIDDVIKNAYEAHNALILDDQWTWFTDTMLSRLEAGGKIAMVMTRWATGDLAGRALAELPSKGYSVKHVNMKAYDTKTNRMLCPEVLPIDDYRRKISVMGADIAAANYQQEPVDIKGRLYSGVRTYVRNSQYVKIWAYVDPADTGSDYLAAIVWGQTVDGRAEIIDVLHTQAPMTVTEQELPQFLARNRVNEARIESNNGGMGFARIIQQRAPSVFVKTFAQKKNKNARIFSLSGQVLDKVTVPQDWDRRWPSFYEAITKYQAQGKNAHDDASDALTGVVETLIGTNTSSPDQYQRQYNELKTLFGR